MKLQIGTGLLVLIFLGSGLAKLASLNYELVAFQRWGYPLWFMYLTGAIEVLAGAALLWRRVTALVAAALACFMIGAVLTHALHAEWPMMALATAIMALAFWRGWAGRADIRALLRRQG
jgi:putative oxidoreductase